eukprot:PITA_21358
MKIDLHMAFDCIDWGFVECLLAKIGLRPHNIRWILACFMNVNYVVIVNDLPTHYFQARRGLRQGCPLSPLLFILIMNTLSLHINKAVVETKIKAIRICRQVYISHNLFIDDVLLFAMLCQSSWICYKDILDRFNYATGLFINKSKSMLYHNDMDLDMVVWISQLFGIESAPISQGLKYLGFHLKPIGYSKHDWVWLTERFYKRISTWEYRYLSLAGRVTLSQAVLLQMAVYWAHLFHLPISIINKLTSTTTNFIWGGSKNQSKFHLTKMHRITMPKNLGGWGLKDLRIFGKSLICKTLCRGIFGTGPWSVTIQQKYLKGRGLKLCKQSFFLPDNVISALRRLGIFTWDKVILDWTGLFPIWKFAEQIGLPAPLSSVWVQVSSSLQASGIMRSGPSDHLYWFSTNVSAPINVKDIYIELIATLVPVSTPIFPTVLWKTGCPPRMIYFAWLLFSNKNLTWDNLRKRSWHGPSRCSICESDEETNFHIFFHCSPTQDIWYELAHLYSFPHVVFDTVQASFLWWSLQCENRRPLLIIRVWFVWRWRNHRIFDDSNVPLNSILPCICSLYEYITSIRA